MKYLSIDDLPPLSPSDSSPRARAQQLSDAVVDEALDDETRIDELRRAIGYFYGAALLAAFQTMFHQSESFSLIPAIAFCFLFFALLNHYLRRRYA